MVGKEEEETEVFLETLARLLIDPAIGHFKLGCFNQPRNSSMMAFSFYVFFSDRTLLCLVISQQCVRKLKRVFSTAGAQEVVTV